MEGCFLCLQKTSEQPFFWINAAGPYIFRSFKK